MKYTLLASSLLLMIAGAAQADDYTLTLKNHVFTPDEITIPANTQVKLTVKNEDNSAAEFESHDLNREKVINAGESVTIMVGPLDAGSYGFVDEFHESTAHGTITVK